MTEPATTAPTSAPERPTAVVRPADTSVLYELEHAYPGGAVVHLEPGTFLLTKTVTLPSNTDLIGSADGTTRIVLAPYSDCHMFTTPPSGAAPTRGLRVENLVIDGNGPTQRRPEGHPRPTFACGFYIRGAEDVAFRNLRMSSIRQTALHFSGTRGVVVTDVEAIGVGWSGASSTDASDVWIEMTVRDAGLDIMHFAIHLDGGTALYVDAEVSDTTGNGIMLDSTSGELSNAVVRGRATRCRRGASLSGSGNHPLHRVLISGDFSSNRETGVMVSNAEDVFIHNSVIRSNQEYGVLCQGRHGGNRVSIVASDLRDNGSDLSELHGSADNWWFSGPTTGRPSYDADPT